VRIFEFIDRQKAEFPVKVLCRVCGVSRSGFYAWAGRGPGGRDAEEETLAREIEAIWEASRRSYGSPRVWRRLRRNGFRLSRKRVARIMAERGWRGRAGRRRVRTTIVDPAAAPAPDLVGRDFTAARPGEKLVGDITYVRTWEGWLYLATVIDVYSRRVVGWSVADHMRASLVGDALEAGAGCNGGRLHGAIFHSDRGSQYTSSEYRQLCERLGVRQSMGRTGVCWDNAVAESFFATLKTELIYTTSWPTKAKTRLAITEWIEAHYNRRRMHSSIDYNTPLEHEQLYWNQTSSKAA
jgi:putative transposase